MKNDLNLSEPHRAALGKLLLMLGKKFLKELPQYAAFIPNFEMLLQSLVDCVPMTKWNTHRGVVPTRNGCLYLIDSKPFMGNGILSDYMTNQIDTEYIENLDTFAENPQYRGLVNKINVFFFDLANGDIQTLHWMLAFIASGIVNMTSCKLAMLLLDLGGCGKSTLVKLLMHSLKKRFALSNFTLKI